MKVMKLRLRLMMSGSQNGRWLTINDIDSGVEVADIYLTHGQVGQLVSTQSIEAVGEIRISDNIGKMHEFQKVRLPIPDGAHENWEEILDEAEKAIASSHPGWKMDREKHNWHRHEAGEYEFRIRRWVDKDEEKKSE